ncbi:MAG: Dyp-type peroxidase [Saprospiraceae bacterium]
MLHFDAPPLAVKIWISSHITPKLTNAATQLRDAGAYRNGRRTYNNTAVINFFLTIEGYEHLELAAPADAAFQRGHNSEATNLELNDTPADWEPPYADDQAPIHAMFMVSDDLEIVLDHHEMILRREFEENGIGRILIVENGNMMRSGGQAIEHFGYADGVNPDSYVDRNGGLTGDWRSVLVADPVKGHGSFMVFRKLEQNVDLFYKELQRLGKNLGGSAMAGAQVVGRFANGMPLTSSDNAYGEQFDYGAQNGSPADTGNRCPFHAHIRKANPRTAGSPKIVRRGIPYDYVGRGCNMDRKPSYGLGLLFICYQHNIANQFEAIQKQLNGPANEHDPLAGQPPSHNEPLDWNSNWGNKGGFQSIFEKVVTVRGGAYFYAPSLEFFESLRVPGMAPGGEVPVAAEGNRYAKRKTGFGRFWLKRKGY